MKLFAIELINNFGYFGILVLTALESIIPVIPAEIVLTLSGAATNVTNITKSGVVIFATLGELTGAIVLYVIGYHISYERMEKLFTGKVGKITHIKPSDIDRSREWFIHKGKYTILFSKCVPVVGSLIAIPAGMTKMNILIFILFSFIGIGIWNTVLVYFGSTLKKCYDIVRTGTVGVPLLLAVVFVAGLAALFIYRQKGNKAS